jgi:hypothetical protein
MTDATCATGFGPLELLIGEWANSDDLAGHGWNMIALPFARNTTNQYRLLVNQYNETLSITEVGACNPNRGLPASGVSAGDAIETGCVGDLGDQQVAALQYVQNIKQAAAADFPPSALPPGPNLLAGTGDAIHHEPGLFLYMKNHFTTDLQVARSGSIPHGDSVMALGTHGPQKDIIVTPIADQNIIPDDALVPNGLGLPSGFNLNELCTVNYLEPYEHFHNNPFVGNTGGAAKFDPVYPFDLLKQANADSNIEILEVYNFDFNTELGTGGINNTPFVVKQADTVIMKVAMRVQKVRRKDNQQIETRLQYAQMVGLDFFEHPAGPAKGSIIRWPHISINTMKKVS